MLSKIIRRGGRGYFNHQGKCFTILNVKLVIFQTNYIRFSPEIKRRDALPIWRAVPQEVQLGRWWGRRALRTPSTTVAHSLNEASGKGYCVLKPDKKP